jgi:lathosterol oxidase
MSHPLPTPAAPAHDLMLAVSEIYPHIPAIIQNDLLRYVIGASAVFLIINTWLSRRLLSRKIRSISPGWNQMRREIITSLRTVLIFAANGVMVGIGYSMGWLRAYADPAEFGWLYFAASIVGIVFLHDAWFYWTHRLIHRPELFRRLHRLHHKSFNPTPWTSYAFNTGEAALNAVFLPLVLLVLPISFLGIFVFTTHMMLRNAIGHCGYEVFPATSDGKPLFSWLTSVTHHDLHHAQAGYNYGLYFTWWDRWMKTENPRYLAEFKRVSIRQEHPEPVCS